MLIYALVQDHTASMALTKALGVPSRHSQAFDLTFLSSWRELLGETQDHPLAFDVVQPDFPPDDPARDTVVSNMEKLRTLMPEGGLIAYLCGKCREGTLLDDMHKIELPFLICQNVDDDPRSILRVMARAEALRDMRERMDLVGDKDSALEPILRALLGWPNRESVGAFALHLKVSPRTLRRQFADLGLLTPRRITRWIRLIEADKLTGLGVESRKELARTMGFRDPETLPCMSQELLGGGTKTPGWDGRCRPDALSAFLSRLTV